MSRIIKMHANKREEIAMAHAGDIVAIVGIKDINTGDTLCDQDSPVLLESIDIPAPVISLLLNQRKKWSWKDGFIFKEDESGRSFF